jgi:predicted nucleic acid-binding protein
VILVDTSIWTDHLRSGDELLSSLLDGMQVVMHPFIVGELAVGWLPNRDVVLASLRNLPQVTIATDEEVLQFVDRQRLYGLGIGYIDAHLLAATRLTPGTSLWTRDKRLHVAADQMALAAYPTH